MAAKPSTTPRWANVGGAIVEPSTGKKDIGWAASERPPAQFFNWWQNLAYQWFEYLKDGTLTGNHSITGDFAVTGNTTFTGNVTVASGVVSPITIQRTTLSDAPLVLHKDNLGNNRTLTDHLGFRMGQVMEWVENWLKTSGAPDGFTFGLTGSGAAIPFVPDSSIPVRTLQLSTGASSGNASVESVDAILTFADAAVVIEQLVRTGSAVDLGTSVLIKWGCSWNAGVDIAQFQLNPDVNANIQINTLGSIFTTAVAVAVNTTYRLRMELLGDNLHAGSNTLIRYFINGTLVREETGTAILTGAAAGKFVFSLDNKGGSSIYSARFGPPRICIAQRPSGDAL